MTITIEAIDKSVLIVNSGVVLDQFLKQNFSKINDIAPIENKINSSW